MSFVFATCQVGAENALKQEVARDWPALRLAFSRPGFITFKSTEPALPPFGLGGAVFARATGVSLGPVNGGTPAERAAGVLQLLQQAGLSPATCHVWPRDLAAPGHRDFEPGLNADSLEAAASIRLAWTGGGELSVNATAAPGQIVLDCILLDSERWWLGWHQATGLPSCWPGGFSPLKQPPHVVSRAWLKMEESILWSGFPIKAGERAAEIGCAPGGSCQSLLDRGLEVMGIDPAEVHPTVLAHPHFTHVRKRGHEVRRREFRKTRWLFADINVAPNYTLESVEGIVTHPEVQIRGMILTLKLLDWQMAAELPVHIERVRQWGFSHVRCRQLHHNRQEVCLAAIR